MNQLKAATETESYTKKCLIAFGSICHMLLALSIGAIFMLCTFKVLNMQSSFELMCENIGTLGNVECEYIQDQIVVYDSYFYCTEYDKDCWSDEALAQEYLN